MELLITFLKIAVIILYVALICATIDGIDCFSIPILILVIFVDIIVAARLILMFRYHV